jgi:DNA polymerase-3 subunit epsilon
VKLHGGIFDSPLAIVDLETTGAHPVHDRITEIAVIEVEEGEVRSEWSTLVNPETTIPSGIQALTGITNAMVADAPTFAELAGDLYERLEGRIVVAHNARFDYGFLKQEFERRGLRYNARTLCTVRLSRKLYPEHARHNLDTVMSRHGIVCQARHRAMGDAQVLWEFLGVAARERGFEALAEAAKSITKQPALPPAIDRAVIDAIPDLPGVYLFYGEAGAPLYVGKSINLRTRILSHFSDDVRSAREAQMAREVRTIETIRTCGELGALLKEAELVKTLLPVFNRQLRRVSGLSTFVFEPGKEPGQALRLAGGEEIESGSLPYMHGLFRTKRAAFAALRELADEHGLCLQSLGYEKAQRAGACFRHQVARCAGLCAGKETVLSHHARVSTALARLKVLAWPFAGPIGLVEKDADRDATDIHVVDNWCYFGTARTDDELAALLESPPRGRFDVDQYKILVRFLAAKARTKVVELPRFRQREDADLLCTAN